MGSTADKLQKVLDSKNAIRDKFSLADNLPFSQYADNISSGADVILGVVDAQGNFQPFEFQGIEATNSGYPEGVSVYYTWDSTLPAPDMSIGDLSFITATAEDILAGKIGADTEGNPIEGLLVKGTDVSDTTATASDVLTGKQFYDAEGTLTQGTLTPSGTGGSATYYKCAEVGLPETSSLPVNTWSGYKAYLEPPTASEQTGRIIISGVVGVAGREYMSGLNQAYYLYSGTGNGRIYISENTFAHGSMMNYGKLYQYNENGTWILRCVASPTANSYLGMAGSLDASIYPDPIGTFANNGDVLSTSVITAEWEMTEGSEGGRYYLFEDTVTEGLTYGKGFTPEVDKVYDADAMVNIQALWTGILPMPTDGLIFYTPLEEMKNSDELGAPLTYYGSAKQSYVYDDELKHTVCKFEGGVITTPIDQYVLPKQITMSMWIKAFTDTSKEWALNMEKQGYAKAYHLRTRCAAIWNNAHDQELFWPESNDRTKWHHYLMKYDGQNLYGYLDGSLVGSQQGSTSSFGSSDYAPISIGTNNTFSDDCVYFEGYITAVRVYNRALSDDEIKLLSTEFTK